VEWPAPALILATLFLNVPFWMMDGDEFWIFSRPPVAVAVLSVAALLCAALFFVGPTVAARTASSFPSMLAERLGSIPGFFIQIACVTYLVIWISRLLALVCRWLQPPYYPAQPAIQPRLLAGAILLLVYVTGCQSVSVNAALAKFTIRLALAILIAALIRVRSGWPAIPTGFDPFSQRSLAEDTWRGFSNLSFYVAPLALLASAFGTRLANRKQVATTALFGIVVPLAGSLTIVTALNVATHASRFYRPSLNPNIVMALVSGVSRTGERAILLIFAITVLGVLRFSVARLKEAAAVRWVPPRFAWIPFGCLISAIVWSSVHADWEVMVPAAERSTEILAAVAAILTVDAVMRRQSHQPQAFDWPATLSLLCGIGIPAFGRFWWSSEDSWGHPWLLPTYGITFMVHLVARFPRNLPPVVSVGLFRAKKRSPKAPLSSSVFIRVHQRPINPKPSC
jgi:hypothetical protein